MVAKPVARRYFSDGTRTNWIKIKNASYTQVDGRYELFEPRGGKRLKAKQKVELALR
jgi:hypothetical protein